MVYRWRCRHCGFTTWAPDGERLGEAVRSHLVKHHRDRLRSEDFGVAWSCPYCDDGGHSHEREQAVASFERHLYGHAEPLVESGVHVADEFDGTGSVLVQAPLDGQGADNARTHFLAPADIQVFVTMSPSKRARLIESDLGEWPAAIVFLTTNEQPLAGVEADLSAAPIEVVQLDGRMGLSGLGETLSRVLDEHETTAGKISVEFDILSELVSKFDLQDVFKFLHVLTSRCDRAGALSHYYFDPRAESASTVNVLDQLFDARIAAENGVFESRG